MSASSSVPDSSAARAAAAKTPWNCCLNRCVRWREWVLQYEPFWNARADRLQQFFVNQKEKPE